jgi:hypothetical protein
MRSLKSGLVAFAVSSLFVGVAVVGCTADGGGADLSTDTPATDPTDTAQLPPPSQSSSGDPGTAVDAGKKDSGKSDAGVDAGPPPPSPGDACTTVDALATRPCGACGTQQAICQAAAGDGGALTWSDYGTCSGELAGGCVPGTVVNEACGNCGTVTKTCTKYCAYTSGSCTGQPTNSCAPNAIDYTNAGCTTPNTYKNRTCGSTCTWSSFSGTCAAPNNPNKMNIAASVGGVTTQQWTLSPSNVGHRADGCGAGTAGSSDVQQIAVEIRNNTAQTASVSVYQSKATGGSELDLYMWYYSKTLPPTDDASLELCDKATDGCSATVPTNLCGNATSYNFAGFSGISIPAGGAILVYSSGYSTSQTGNFNLNVKTDSLM